MISIINRNLRIQVKKLVLKELLSGKRFHIELESSKYWKKELIDIKLVDDELVTALKQIDTITISNGLHPDLPIYKYESLRYFLDKENNKFVFQLGQNLTKAKTPIVTKQLNLFG